MNALPDELGVLLLRRGAADLTVVNGRFDCSVPPVLLHGRDR
jgi:hypothetical protein